MPRIVTVESETILSGLEVVFDGTVFTTPVSLVSWEGHAMNSEVTDKIATSNGEAYKWVSWSDGGNQVYVVTTTIVASHICGDLPKGFRTSFPVTSPLLD